MNFLNTVANASLENLNEFEKYEGDSALDKINLGDVASKVSTILAILLTISY